MEIVYFLLFVSILSRQPLNGARLELLRSQSAVTSPEYLEDLYVRIKHEIRNELMYVESEGQSGQLRKEDYWGPIRYPPVEKFGPVENTRDEDLEDKVRICARIFNSGFFETRREKAVDFHFKATETQKELSKTNPDLHKDIYGDWPRISGEWLNPYRKRDVFVGEAQFIEKVFRCVTSQQLESHPPRYVGYFISAIYQSLQNPMDGRFVFVSDEGNKLKVFALAEEPAVVNNDVVQKTHRAYFDARNQPHPELDTMLCTLSETDKIRFCTLVLNATGFPYKIKFPPIADHVESPRCIKKRVLADGVLVEVERTRGIFSKVQYKVKMLVEMTYEEWMLGCKEIPVGGFQQPQTLTYYVSRGLDERTAIVFKPSSEILYLAPDFGVTGVPLVFGSSTYKTISLGRMKEVE